MAVKSISAHQPAQMKDKTHPKGPTPAPELPGRR